MSSPSGGGLARAAALALLCMSFPATPSLGAQERQEEEAALAARLDSLLPLYHAASEQAARARARREASEKARTRAATDTITVGPLNVVTLPDQVAVARNLFRQALEEYGPAFRDSPALSSALFTFQWSARPQNIAVEGRPVYRVEAFPWATRTQMVKWIVARIGSALREDYGDTRTAEEWFNGAIVPPRPPARRPANNYEAPPYYQLVTTPSKANRACLDGDGVACIHALGLDLGADPLQSWYAPEERRAMVMRVSASRGYRSAHPEMAACREHISACDEFLHELMSTRSSTSFAPLHGLARGSLLWLALQRGGDGAWSRFISDPGASPTEALEHASGLTATQLGDAWSAWVLDRRPGRAGNMKLEVLFGLIWILLLVALATRSTRWRLG